MAARLASFRNTIGSLTIALGIALAYAGCGLDGKLFFNEGGMTVTVGSGGASSSSGAGGLSVGGDSAADTSSSSSSSSSSSAGGSGCPNGVCDPDETHQSCPDDCRDDTCAHSPCSVGVALNEACDPCVTPICAKLPTCCTEAWTQACADEAPFACMNACCGDGACVGEDCSSCPQDCKACECGDGVCQASESCTSCASDCGPCPDNLCAHTVCTVGEALDPSRCHGTCVSQVCAQDAGCCRMNGTAWDERCEQIAEQLCGGPDPCVVAVCDVKPECCVGGGPSPTWDQACVNLAKTHCNTSCNCTHDVCSVGDAFLSDQCNPCAAAVCEADSYCCVTSWDLACTKEAEKICGIDCP